MNSEVRVHQVGIAAGPGLASLDFIEVARVIVVADGRPETTTEILGYDRSAAASAPLASAIQVSPPAPIDITIPWTSDNTVVSVQVAGQLPTQDWTVDLTLTLSGKITYEY